MHMKRSTSCEEIPNNALCRSLGEVKLSHGGTGVNVRGIKTQDLKAEIATSFAEAGTASEKFVDPQLGLHRRLILSRHCYGEGERRGRPKSQVKQKPGRLKRKLC